MKLKPILCVLALAVLATMATAGWSEPIPDYGTIDILKQDLGERISGFETEEDCYNGYVRRTKVVRHYRLWSVFTYPTITWTQTHTCENTGYTETRIWTEISEKPVKTDFIEITTETIPIGPSIVTNIRC